MFVITQILHLSLRTDHGLFPSRHSQILLFFLMKNVCQSSSLQSKLRSIEARLNWLPTVIDGQKSRRTLDEMLKSDRSRLDTSFCTRWSGSSQLASAKPCRGQHVLEQSYTANQHGAWISCARCAFRPHYIPRHTARMTSVSTPSSASVQEARKRMSLLRDNDHGEGGKGHDCRSRRTEASKEETDTTNDDRVQHVYNSGAASSAMISSGTPVRRDISTPPSPQSSPTTRLWRRFVVGILQKERMRVRRENALMMDEDL